jgi:hypothetical protein
MSNPNHDEELYAQAAAELEDGTRDEGLWAKCFAECDGEENKAKARYLKARVQRLGDGNDTASKGNKRELTSEFEPASSDKEEEPREVEFAYADVEHPKIGWLFSKAWESFSIAPWMCIANFIIYAFLDLLLFCTLIGNLVRPALYGGYMESMMRLARGQKVGIGDFIQYGFKPPFSTANGAGWLLVLALFASVFLIFLPCFYLFTIWFFVFPIILHERIGIVEAFRKSKLMTKGSFWKVFPKFLVALALFATGLGIPLAVLIKVHYYFALTDVEDSRGGVRHIIDGESNVERINREYDEEKRKGRSDPNDL